MKKQKKIIIYGDSIVSCSFLKLNKRWVQILKKNLNKKYRKSFNLKTFSLNGATTNDAVANFKLIKKIKKIDLLIFMFGINDSVYWMSKRGKPRVNINKFKKNIIKLVKKTNKNYNARVVFMLAHEFAQNRLEGNNKTHNHNYKKYRKTIINISKKFKTKIIDMRKKLTSYPAKRYCLPLPDGLHLNNFGSLKYSEFVYKFLINEVIKKS